MVSLRAAVAALGLAAATARIHHLQINNDPRFAFSIESFGFLVGGTVNVRIHDVSATPAGEHLMGFVVYRTGNEADVERQIEILREKDQCALMAEVVAGGTKLPITKLPIPNNRSQWDSGFTLTETIAAPGLYDILFAHCTPKGAKVTFTAEIEFQNPNGNYLSAGEQPLPYLYFAEGLAFMVAFVVWFRYTRAHKGDMHKLHHLMTMLVFAKMISLFFEAAMFHYIQTTGHSTGWNIAFYIATFFRGILMISVIALIGAGWSLLKPFLNDREKKLLVVALPLQVLSNIAIIVTDEWAPGSISYNAWFNVLKLADLLAAAIVLLPILWSIKTLKDAQAADSADEKTRNTLVRLTQFRSFYVMTLSYIYFTRIIVYLLTESLPYSKTWVAPFCEETATLAFYYFGGYRFRPAADNSDYLQVPADEDAPADSASGGGAPAAASDPEDDMAISMSTSSNTRVTGSSQTLSKTKVESFNIEKEREDRAAAKAAAAANRVAIADDDKEDDFGLDEDDDDLELDVGPSASVAHAPTRMKHVPKEKA